MDQDHDVKEEESELDRVIIKYKREYAELVRETERHKEFTRTTLAELASRTEDIGREVYSKMTLSLKS